MGQQRPAVDEEVLGRALLAWATQFKGRPWNEWAPRLPAEFGDFLLSRYPWLDPETVHAIARESIRITGHDVNFNTKLVAERLSELGAEVPQA